MKRVMIAHASLTVLCWQFPARIIVPAHVLCGCMQDARDYAELFLGMFMSPLTVHAQLKSMATATPFKCAPNERQVRTLTMVQGTKLAIVYSKNVLPCCSCPIWRRCNNGQPR